MEKLQHPAKTAQTEALFATCTPSTHDRQAYKSLVHEGDSATHTLNNHGYVTRRQHDF